eukprot:5013711-Amphidinium_carterae.1
MGTLLERPYAWSLLCHLCVAPIVIRGLQTERTTLLPEFMEVLPDHPRWCKHFQELATKRLYLFREGPGCKGQLALDLLAVTPLRMGTQCSSYALVSVTGGGDAVTRKHADVKNYLQTKGLRKAP